MDMRVSKIKIFFILCFYFSVQVAHMASGSQNRDTELKIRENFSDIPVGRPTGSVDQLV